MYDVIIVGAGFAGATLARKFADDNKKVLILEKRAHIGGNMYEDTLENGVRVHKYGPHIFHTNNEEVFDFLKKYSGWYFYEHRVLGKIDGNLVPIPFNFKSIEILFEEQQAEMIKKKLKDFFPNQIKVSILDLIDHQDQDIKKFGEYVYEKVFANYTAKQWNIPVSEIDTSVINRVPVILGYDDRYFQDKFQFMPKCGYTEVFHNMLNSDNIEIRLNCDAKDLLTINITNKEILFDGKPFKGIVVFSGALDELLDYKFGALPYRSLNLVFENYNVNYYQPTSVVNYPNEEKFTRITEFKYLSNQQIDNNTTILKEYPMQYNHLDKDSIPYYAIFNKENLNLYDKYYNDVKDIQNFYLCGRLAEYKYYNMDAVIERALNLYKEISGE